MTSVPLSVINVLSLLPHYFADNNLNYLEESSELQISIKSYFILLNISIVLFCEEIRNL